MKKFSKITAVVIAVALSMVSPEIMVDAAAPSWPDSVKTAPDSIEITSGDIYRTDVKSVLINGLDYNGKKTQFFAFWAMPDVEPGEKVPGIVLMHGSGGTAYRDWVRKWVKRGYAAIAPYWVESEDDKSKCDIKGIPESYVWNMGPRRNGTFKDWEAPIADQWMYHAVADTMLAHSFLASQEGVDADKIGICGVSWGGIITSYTIGVDDRFSFAIPIYGTGFLKESKAKISKDLVEDGLNMWDPSTVLNNAKMPTLFINSNNDTYFSLNLQARAYGAVEGSRLSIKNGLTHGHDAAFALEEAYSFADSIVKGGTEFTRFTDNKLEFKDDDIIACATYESASPLTSAKLWYTTDSEGLKYTNYTYNGTWQSKEIELGTTGVIRVQLPDDTKGYYIEATDSLDRVNATPYVELEAAVNDINVSKPSIVSVTDDAEGTATMPLSGVVRAKSLISNGGAKPLCATIVLAIYDVEGKMAAITTKPYSIAQALEQICVADIDVDKLSETAQSKIAQGGSVKAFVLDSIKTLKPLCAFEILSK